MLPSIQSSVNLFKLLRTSSLRQCLVGRMTSTVVESSSETGSETATKKAPHLDNKVISKSMKAYLERAQEHEAFMKERNSEYQIGKRHLANMMGEDPETFTQKDVDEAIQYLFPSGIYEKKARPHMLPPEEVFPQRKAAEFDISGRPFHFLFYTSNPNYYKLLFDIVENINELNKFEDSMIKKNLQPDVELKIDMSGAQWLDQENLERKLIEPINPKIYDHYVSAMQRLVDHPYSYRKKDFILSYTKQLLNKTKNFEIPKLKIDEKGRSYITTYECLRKTARAHVTLRSPGTGQVEINGKDLTYFRDLQPREQILFPLIFTGMLNKVDVEAHVEGGGVSGQAGAIRWGIAWSLRSFMDEEMIEKMRIAGLLTRDRRRRERKKPGQEGARRKFTWKKR